MPLSNTVPVPDTSASGDQEHRHPEQSAVPASDMDTVALPRGETIGRYEIVSLLRQDTLGPVYRGRDRILGRDVMIREFLPAALAIRSDGVNAAPRSPEVTADFERARQRFTEEARNLSRLQRAPFLVRVVDLVEANNTFYVVLDLVPGISLEDRLHGRKLLQPEEVDRLLRALLEALMQLHEAGLVHGDINPANIMIDMSGRPTLVNVGGEAAMTLAIPRLAMVSRPQYAAPEQLGDDPLGPWTDIYGLAATLHCAALGYPPPNPAERLRSDDYRRLVALAPSGFPPALLAGIDRGLELAATDRPQSVAEWQAMLWTPGSRALTAAPPSQVEHLHRGPEPPARGRGLAFWPIVGAATLTVTAAGIGVHYLNGTRLLIDAFSSVSSPRLERLDPNDKLAWERADAQSRQAALEEIRRNRAAEQAALDAVEAEMRRQEEARQKAEADAAAEARRLRQEEERAILKKLEAEAEAKQQAEAEAEARRRAEAEAAARELAEAEAKRQTEMLDLKAAEAEETALHLSKIDRQHVQVALNALGFDTGEFDGSLGGQMRKAIADWQRGHKLPPTGFLTSDQIHTILEDAPPQAIPEFDALQDPRNAEANEVALHLAPVDRQHVQVVLVSLGFDPGDIDGIFGPRTRQMIAVWQTSRGDAPTGFLTSLQLQTLLKSGATAINIYDDTEAREAALNLSRLDRQHVQVALTAQGFDTSGVDGRFGPRTRQMIAAWQKAHDRPPSGFLTDADLQTLLEDSAAAIAKFDGAQKTVAAVRNAPPIDGSTTQSDTSR